MVRREVRMTGQGTSRRGPSGHPARRPLRSRRFSLDTGLRPVSDACSGEPREVPDNEVNAHLGNPGLSETSISTPIGKIARPEDVTPEADLVRHSEIVSMRAAGAVPKREMARRIAPASDFEANQAPATQESRSINPPSSGPVAYDMWRTIFPFHIAAKLPHTQGVIHIVCPFQNQQARVAGGNWVIRIIEGTANPNHTRIGDPSGIDCATDLALNRRSIIIVRIV